MTVIEKFELAEVYRSLTKAERQILTYIKGEIDEIDRLTVEKIAQNCFCSTTTVNRFCKKVGMTGFSELKESIRYEQNRKPSLPNEYYVDDLEAIVRRIDFTQIEEIMSSITKNQRIYIFGTGASFIAAQYLSRLLLRLGFWAYATNEKHLVLNALPDVLVAISKSGDTFTTLSTLYEVPESCLKIGITKKESRIARACEFNLTHSQDTKVDDSILNEIQLPILLIISELINKLCKKYNCS